MKQTATNVAADQAINTVHTGAQNAKSRPTYSYNEVITAATEYFKGDELAASVWRAPALPWQHQ